MFEGDGRVEEYVGGYADWERYRIAIGASTSLASAIDAAGRRGRAGRDAARAAGAGPGGGADQESPVRAAADRQSGGRQGRRDGERPPPAPAASAKVKLSFKEQRELAALPAVIEALEAEREALRARTTAPEFYKEPADAIRVALTRLEAIDPELAAAYDRWNVLDARG